MKSASWKSRRRLCRVRPLAGAGIEILSLRFADTMVKLFAPSRGRELKFLTSRLSQNYPCVRPLAGAGIEIDNGNFFADFFTVRPLAGAGIEIKRLVIEPFDPAVRPLAGAGIEISSLRGETAQEQFAPSRGRELKFEMFACNVSISRSPPRGGGN